jgi:hypothetical protein
MYAMDDPCKPHSLAAPSHLYPPCGCMQCTLSARTPTPTLTPKLKRKRTPKPTRTRARTRKTKPHAHPHHTHTHTHTLQMYAIHFKPSDPWWDPMVNFRDFGMVGVGVQFDVSVGPSCTILLT